MPLINATTLPGSLIVAITTQNTGSLFLTLIVIFLFLLIACAAFRIPIELTAVLVLPISIYFMAATSQFYVVGGVLAIYTGILFAKWIFIR